MQASKVKQTILAVAIAIILVLFVGFGIDTIYDSPDYTDYCNETIRPMKLDQNQVDCIDQGGEWIQNQENSYCDFSEKYRECEEEYNQVKEPYERNVFIIALIIGLVAVIVGGLILSVESVGSGIMGGGVLILIYGTLRYWGELSKYLRVVVLGIVLAILIWIGYKKFKK